MLNYHVDTIEEVRVVALEGEWDAQASSALLTFVESEVKDGHRKVVIDCSALGFISSHGIATLVRIGSRIRNRNGDVRLAALRGSLMKVFEITRVVRLFKIYPNVEQAAESYRGDLWM